MSLKPLIKGSGGKSDEIKLFEKYFPVEYDTYLEPFIGGGSVYFTPFYISNADFHDKKI